jgi:hypothetical protein
MPANFRFVGILFFILGFVLGVIRFKYGFKPEILDMKMFAFASSYIQTKYMEIIGNNMGEEIVSFFLLTGLFLIAFSREKNESEEFNVFRLKAFFMAAYSNFVFLLVAVFFTYGFSFVYMLIVNMGFGLLVFIAAFQLMLFKSRSNKSD